MISRRISVACARLKCPRLACGVQIIEAFNCRFWVEGIEAVDNQIEILPVSPSDDRLRLRLYRAIYGYIALQRYGMPVIKPIRILVKNGNVTLEGVVDSEGDKNIANIQARGVSGAFSVNNNLVVSK